MSADYITNSFKRAKSPLGVWLLTVLLSLLLTGALAPIAIWVNLEHNEILYESRIVQANLVKSSELLAKLEVEHGRLISPYVLEEKAKAFSMAMASSGQVRRLAPEQEEELARLEKEARAKELAQKALIEKEKAQLALAKKEAERLELERLQQEEAHNNFIMQEAARQKTISQEELIAFIVKIGNIDLFKYSTPLIEKAE